MEWGGCWFCVRIRRIAHPKCFRRVLWHSGRAVELPSLVLLLQNCAGRGIYVARGDDLWGACLQVYMGTMNFLGIFIILGMT